jgi:hypothetical protein
MWLTMRTALLPLLTAVIFSGCVHIESHPKSWNPDSSSADSITCPPISGVFDNHGENPKGESVNLAQWLNLKISHNPKTANADNDLFRELSMADSVALQLSDDGVLNITAEGGGESNRWSFQKSKGQLKCKGGSLLIHLSGDGSGDGVAAYASVTLELRRVGGDLIVNKHGGSGGVMLLIPAFGYESAWGRFKTKATQ